jgi:ribonuclease J
MVKLTFHGGVGEIGGNKILLEDENTSILLDFGKNFEKERRYYDEPYIKPREEKHLIYLGLLPKIEGLYKKDEREPSIDAILFTHPHADHVDYVRYVKDSIPLYCGETAKTMILAKEMSASGHLKEYKIARMTRDSVDVPKTFKTFRTGDKKRLGSIEIEPIHVDHSTPGAYAYILHTSGGTIVYTGDFRLHGPRAEMSREFVEKAKEASPEALIIEGTNIVDAKTATEKEVKEKISRIVSDAPRLVLAGFSLNDIDRLKTFYEVAKKNGRKLAMSMKQAYIVYRLREESFPIFRLNDPNILIFQREKRTTYKWEKEVIDNFSDNVATGRDINAMQGEVLLAASFYDMNEMVEILPESGSIYILSQSEPFNEEMEINHEKMLNWLERCGLPLYQVHASGHADPHQLKWAISEIGAKKVFTIHTERPRLMARYMSDLDTEIISPTEGEMYAVE